MLHARPPAAFAAIIGMENRLLPGFVTATVLFSALLSLVMMAVVLALL